MDIYQKLSAYAAKNGLEYAFYTANRDGSAARLESNQEVFSSASIIKVPILLAWIYLERSGAVNRKEIADLDATRQVGGAGFSWLMAARKLPYQDVLLLMISLSDNLCTNLVLEKIGLERLARIFTLEMGLQGTRVERKLMDFAAREQGLDNFISAADCIRFYEMIDRLSPPERELVENMLAVNMDDALLKRSIPRDTLAFYHKTGSIEGVLHDWGYTRQKRIFLLTQQVADEPALFELFGEAGESLLLT